MKGILKSTLVLLPLTLFASCGTHNPIANNTEDVIMNAQLHPVAVQTAKPVITKDEYKDLVKPILDTQCMGCHQDHLTSYTEFKNGVPKMVDTVNIMKSYGAAPSDADVHTLTQWSN